MKPGAGGEPTMPTPSPWEPRARTGSPARTPSPGSADPPPGLTPGAEAALRKHSDRPLLVFYSSDPGPGALEEGVFFISISSFSAFSPSTLPATLYTPGTHQQGADGS